MQTHPQLWPLYQDKHRQQRLAQPVSLLRVASPVRAAALARLVNLQQAVEAATAAGIRTLVETATVADIRTLVEAATVADIRTLVEAATVADMETELDMEAPPEAVAAMDQAPVMAISTVDMATSTGGTKRNNAKDILRRKDQFWGIRSAPSYGWQGLVWRQHLTAGC